MGVQAPVAARPSAAAWRPLYSVLGDDRLARLVSDGNKQAFAPLYERYYQQLYRYCRSIVHDDVDAQDALQSTFASAFAALRKGQRDAPLRPWLFRIAHNEAVSVIRRRRPVEELSEASEPCGDSVEEQAGERARFALLMQDLSELPERQRSALVMRELSGLSHEEIAIVLGTSVGAAKQTIFEARRSLSEFAEGRVMACDEVRKVVSDADGRTLRSRRVRAHLTDCSSCAEFAAAIATRSADLRALSPTLPATAAAALLARSLGAGSGHSGGGAAGLAAGTAGKTAGAALATKALAGVVIVAAGTVGAAAGLGPTTGSSHSPAARTTSRSAAPAAAVPATAATTGTQTARRRGKQPVRQASSSKRPGNQPGTGAGAPKLTRLAGVSIPATRPQDGKAGVGAPATAGTTGPATPQQQAQPTSEGSQAAQHGGGGHGASGSSPAKVSVPGGSATVKVPGGSASVSVPAGSASVSLPGASATVSVPGGSASVSVPGASASASVPNGSASVAVPGASATVSVPNGTTVSVGGDPTLHLPGLGSLLGPLGGSGAPLHG